MTDFSDFLGALEEDAFDENPVSIEEFVTSKEYLNLPPLSEIQYQLIAVHKAMFTEANPIPVKWALHQMGKITSGIRLPLTPLSNALREPLKAALKQANLL